jgi:hypothetical protein
MGRKYRTYYVAAYTDSGCLCGCDHRHPNVMTATACISQAGGYVIAVRNRKYRALNAAEEAEFQEALYGRKETKTAELPAFPDVVKVKA